MPVVPYRFDRPEDGEIADLLVRTERDGIVTVRWLELNLELCHSGKLDDFYPPKLEDIARSTPGFVPLGLYGFALNQFSEVLLYGTLSDVCVPDATVMLGTVEATVGSPSPLFHYLMYQYHDNDVFPPLDEVSTLRVWGASPQDAEAYILSACRHLRDDAGVRCRLWSLEFEYPDDDESVNSPIKLDRPPAVLDIEPIRLYYRGLVDDDDMLAIIHYYRALEFYSIMSKVSDVAALRGRPDLSPRAFLTELTKTLGGDERADICRLMGRLADAGVLAEAQRAGLTAEPTASSLGNALYDFRNSIVHGKYDHRTALLVPSVFAGPEPLPQWRSLLRVLAAKAIDTFGVRGRP